MLTFKLGCCCFCSRHPKWHQGHQLPFPYLVSTKWTQHTTDLEDVCQHEKVMVLYRYLPSCWLQEKGVKANSREEEGTPENCFNVQGWGWQGLGLVHRWVSQPVKVQLGRVEGLQGWDGALDLKSRMFG